jgi:hypothetical protein
MLARGRVGGAPEKRDPPCWAGVTRGVGSEEALARSQTICLRMACASYITAALTIYVDRIDRLLQLLRVRLTQCCTIGPALAHQQLRRRSQATTH